MALVDSTSYSYHDTIRKSQQSRWLGHAGLEVNTEASTGKPAQCKLNPPNRPESQSSSHARHVGTATKGWDSILAPSLDAAAPFDRISIDHREWYISPAKSPHQLGPEPYPAQKRPFHKWIKSLHRRASHRPLLLDDHPLELPLPDQKPHDVKDHNITTLNSRPLSSSGSSYRFVSAVRSASVSLASVSVANRSRRIMARSHCLSRTDRSSRVSLAGPRLSEDSIPNDRPILIDAAVTERALQRRRILEELIDTEEGYIGDVRFLINVYITILASLPALSSSLRSSIKRNLTDIVELHETILGELHRTVPYSEYTQLSAKISIHPPSNHVDDHFHSHRRWRSMDAVRDRSSGMPLLLHELPGMTAEPQVAAEVAKIFEKRMNRFFIYKEYGAKYELMMKDIACANSSMPEWDSYQRGLEALALTLGSAKGTGESSKKSLTVSDLLVKPIQRVCKYPLLFAELLKYTPVSDCPNSHMEIESALTRLREATAEINKATNDVRVKATLEKTWLLQDRLVFPHRKLDAASRNQVRSFGRIHLCGALHVCWQTKDGVSGQYMVCLLYQNVLCLASAGKIDHVYTIMASINLGGAKVEAADNGRGLQCHTAPFSWKLVFECDHQLYEIIMTACSPKEESEWRARLDHPGKSFEDIRDSSVFTSLELDLKSLGSIFGKPGTSARRLSIHRATTVGSKATLYQVVLKNTSVARDGAGTSTSGLAINRSQSFLTTNTRLPVLTPSRNDRCRLEGLLSDVWSREALPFPGMAVRSRSEHLVRASSVMRKLSVSSFGSSFGKRSGSGMQPCKQSEPCSRNEVRGPYNGLDFDEHATSNEADLTVETMVTMSKPTRDETNITKLPDDMAGLLVASKQGVMREYSQYAVREATRRSSEDSAKAGVPLLPAYSSHNLHVGDSEKPAPPSMRSMAKENTHLEHLDDKTRSSSRWAKVGIARNDSMGHSFRSLFR